IGAVAQALERTPAEVGAAIERARKKLLEARGTRDKPFRDDKILASWNGLVIAALADAGVLFGERSLLGAAERAYDHVSRRLVHGGDVLRFVKGDEVVGPGFLDDHAFLAAAALALHQATGNERRLGEARRMVDRMLEQFGNEEGALFFTPGGGEKLI